MIVIVITNINGIRIIINNIAQILFKYFPIYIVINFFIFIFLTKIINHAFLYFIKYSLLYSIVAANNTKHDAFGEYKLPIKIV